MSSHRIITADIILYDVATSQGNDTMDMFSASADPQRLWTHLERLCGMGRLRGGASGMGLVVRSLGVNLPAASVSFTVTRASWTAGDVLNIATRGGEVVPLTAVSGTADPTQGQYAQGAATDTDLAVQIKNAVNLNSRLWKSVTATNSTNTVTLTAVGDTQDFNSIKLYKVVTTSGVFSFSNGTALSGALPVANSATTATVTLAAVATANDTLVIGPVTLTWVASSANENQVTIGANTTVASTNLAAIINAHSILKNYVTASPATNVTTITTTYSTPDMKAWTLTKTGTYNPTLAGGFYPTTATLEGADQVRATNIR